MINKHIQEHTPPSAGDRRTHAVKHTDSLMHMHEHKNLSASKCTHLHDFVIVEVHSGSDRFPGLLGTLCYEFHWLIGPEQEVCTGDPDPFSYHPSSHAASCSGFAALACDLYFRVDISTVAGGFFTSLLGRGKVQRDVHSAAAHADRTLLCLAVAELLMRLFVSSAT